MSTDEDDELDRLRRRAYSPTADIGSDPAALARLAELERRAAGAEPTPDADPLGAATSTDANPGSAAAAPDDQRPAVAREPRWRPRRSTVLLLGAAALVLIVAATALTLVQRVQVHPLQADAEQVARLVPDPAFEVPDYFSDGTPGTMAYSEFQGFRVTVAAPGGTEREGESCLMVWQPALVSTDAATGVFSYSGQFVPSQCSAGTFPAVATIRLFDQSPERAQTEYPADTSLQFVYDRESDEVVVFRG